MDLGSGQHYELTYALVLHALGYDHPPQTVSCLQHLHLQHFVIHANVCARDNVIQCSQLGTKLSGLPDFESITQFWHTGCSSIEEIVCFWSNSNMLK